MSEEAARKENVVLASAVTGEGIEALAEACSARLTSAYRIRELRLDPSQGAAIAWIHANGRVVDQSSKAGKLILSVRLSNEDYGRFQSRFG